VLDNPYLKLLRIPNIFTVPPDIILGYLIAISSLNASSFTNQGNNILDLVMLVISSILLYLGGLVSNDLFDFKTDKIERPNRPLPSGAVQKKSAIILTVLFFVSGFILSSFINITSAAISGLLVISILLYNYKLKNGFYRPFVMGAIRSLNVIFGFSFIFGFSGSNTFLPFSNIAIGYTVDLQLIMLLALSCLSIFFHIFVLTYISSKETTREYSLKNKKSISIKKIFYFYFSFLAIIGIVGSFLVEYQTDYLVFLLSLGLFSSLVYLKSHQKMLDLVDDDDDGDGSLAMQFIVKSMITLLILLDSTFIAGMSGAIIGLAVAIFFIFPSIILSKKISMT